MRQFVRFHSHTRGGSRTRMTVRPKDFKTQARVCNPNNLHHPQSEEQPAVVRTCPRLSGKLTAELTTSRPRTTPASAWGCAS